MLQYMRIRLAAKSRTDRGATAVEYGLLVALIAAAIVALVAVLGGYLSGAFDSVNDELGKAKVPAGKTT